MKCAILILLGSVVALAQGGGGFGRMSGGVPQGATLGGAGFGRILFPGTGAPAAVRTPVGRGSFYAAPPAVHHPAHGRQAVVPYPVFVGGGYYAYDAPPAPEAVALPPDYGLNPYQQQSPVVIINQNFRPDVVNPVMRDYSQAQLPEPLPRAEIPEARGPVVVNDDSPTIYLIAMKDRSIFATVAYWVDGETLNYVTREGSLNHVTLGLVDRDFSKQLNDERRVDFKLPAPK